MNDRQAVSLPAEFELGIMELDTQHGQLFGLLTELDACRGKRYSASKAKDILERMLRATELHFAMEECTMRLLGYPEAETHKAAHRELSAQLSRIQHHLIDQDIAEKLHDRIEQWLTEHIVEVDRLFVSHFMSAGVVSRG